MADEKQDKKPADAKAGKGGEAKAAPRSGAPKSGGAKGGGAKSGGAKGGGTKRGEGGGGGGKKVSMLPTEHAGAGKAAPAPRLHEFYASTVRPSLAKRFGLTNMHQIPNLTKIVLNVGFGEAIKQPKLLDTIVEELSIITGQRPVKKKAKKSIANFGLREGLEIGVCVTLRGARMWEFLDRFISTAIPRIRDFRGLNTRSFDGRGNYSLGLKEQMMFPEINYDLIDQVHGMDITIVTTTNRDDHALALLQELGMPFKGEDKGMKSATRGAA
jgi:large subunit ribosomal protein L5